MWDFDGYRIGEMGCLRHREVGIVDLLNVNGRVCERKLNRYGLSNSTVPLFGYSDYLLPIITEHYLGYTVLIVTF